jgi:hypothetical protein
VHVDKSGRDDLILCIDDALSFAVIDAADKFDAAVFDADIGPKPRITGAVDNPAIRNYHIVNFGRTV